MDFFLGQDYIGCLVEYYPRITMLGNMCGRIENEKKETTDKIEKELCKIFECEHSKYTEYVYKNKIMCVHSDTKLREYKRVMQIAHNISPEGLIIASKIQNIDGSKFPILNEYYDIRHTNSIVYKNHCASVHIIITDNYTNLKIVYTVSGEASANVKTLESIKTILCVLRKI